MGKWEFIPLVGWLIYHGEGVKISWVGGLIYHC